MSKEVHAVKEMLFELYGTRCEVCGKEFARSELTGHHIVMKSKGGQATMDNILIACYQCHFGYINQIPYDSKEYWELMKRCLRHRGLG